MEGGGGGQNVLTYLENIFNNVLKTKHVPGSWHEAKILIIFKKQETPQTLSTRGPLAFFHIASKH